MDNADVLWEWLERKGLRSQVEAAAEEVRSDVERFYAPSLGRIGAREAAGIFADLAVTAAFIGAVLPTVRAEERALGQFLRERRKGLPLPAGRQFDRIAERLHQLARGRFE